jgi:hypothetical protein
MRPFRAFSSRLQRSTHAAPAVAFPHRQPVLLFYAVPERPGHRSFLTSFASFYISSAPRRSASKNPRSRKSSP